MISYGADGFDDSITGSAVPSNIDTASRSRSASETPLKKQNSIHHGNNSGQFQHSKFKDEWSAIPNSPSFSDLATNSVAVVPLLSQSQRGESYPDKRRRDFYEQGIENPYTGKSFKSLMAALLRYNSASEEEQHDILVHASRQRRETPGLIAKVSNASENAGSIAPSSAVLIVPNSQLTRPGDWRYDNTPLVNFDWNSGCQRIRVFDARPHASSHAYDRIENPTIAAPWSDLIPSRTTIAVVGVVNLKDCQDTQDLLRAERELEEWAVRYSTLRGYAAVDDFVELKDGSTASARQVNGDEISIVNCHKIITRMFVFDSFDEACQTRIDLSQSSLGMDLIAFPPSDEQHSHMLDLHLKIVVNDLAVAFFRALEGRIKHSDFLAKSAGKPVASGFASEAGTQSNHSRAGGRAAAAAVSALANLAVSVQATGGDGSSHGIEDDDSDVSPLPSVSATTSSTISATGGGGLVRGMIRNAMNAAATSAANALNNAQSQAFGPSHRLLTPLDGVVDMNGITLKDLEALQKREVGRREKHSADLSLLAGSPLDAYERYNRAAELTKSAHDPLWYAAALEGCAASFIAMADQGGHGVDNYLENNFRMPDEILSIVNAELLKSSDGTKRQIATLAAIDKTKTTLPGAVFFLAEEALVIFSKHPKLASLHAELALKLATYIAEWEDSHRMCRWGYGPYCYTGEMGNQKRYELPSMLKLLQNMDTSLLKDQIAKDTWTKCRRVTELLHKAVSSGALDPRTRSDVARKCAEICLKGIPSCFIPTGNLSLAYSGSASSARIKRLRLPRKAAFFATISAQAMSHCTSSDARHRSANLWIALSQLLSHYGNKYGEDSNYAWVALRLAALHGLAQQVDGLASEQAYELLLVLLSEISPDVLSRDADARRNSYFADPEISSNSRHSEAGVASNKSATSNDNSSTQDDLDDSSAVTSGKASSTPSGGRNAPLTAQSAQRHTRTGIFGAGRINSTVLAQARWADEAPISQAILPLVELTDLVKRNIYKSGDDTKLNHITNVYDSLCVLSLSCVRHKVGFENCASSQQKFISSLLDLRRNMPTTTSGVGINISSIPRHIPEPEGTRNSIIPPPLKVRSATVVKADSQLLLERTKASGYAGKNVGMSMATFFNPYAVKKSASSGAQSTLVAEGEERVVEVVFENRLSVQLDVPSCRLEFDQIGAKRIEAAPLSFVIPAKSKDFRVYFPFVVVPSSLLYKSPDVDSGLDPATSSLSKTADSFQLLGLKVTCMNRCFPISFDGSANETKLVGGSQKFVPNPASIYPLLKVNKKGGVGSKSQPQAAQAVRVESVPAQPTLNVSFTTSETPLEDAAIVPVHLSDGEIYTIPPFRLQTDFGASGQGRIERLQLIAAGLPGLPEEVLFDTEGLEAARKDDDVYDDEMEMGEEDAFEELMEEDGLPPLRMKVLTEDLHLGSINDKDKAQEGSVVKFQIAAAHDMGNQLANGGNVRIRFRYRGASPNEATEIWRRTEVRLRIVRVKGPRISSLSFRPDLSWGSAFSELSHSLAQQRKRIEALPNSESEKHAQRLAALSSKSPNALNTIDFKEIDGDQKLSILERVGTDASTNVSGGEAVVLMAVANETNSTIVLSNREGRVGGFQGSPMPTIRVTSGVSVKIPVVIQRIERLDEKGQVTDIVSELIARTALQWESVVGEGETNKRVRRGRVRIPSRCLREIIEEHGSFASRICKAPIQMNVDIGHKGEGDMMLEPGKFVIASVELRVNGKTTIFKLLHAANLLIKIPAFSKLDWVPFEAISRCKLMLEFCCAQKDSVVSRDLTNETKRPAYIWCGQLRRTFYGSECFKDNESGYSTVMVHRAKITFLRKGIFAVSACVKISLSSPEVPKKSSHEEVWWAPRAETVMVGINS